MIICNPIIAFFNDFSRVEIIAIIAILTAVVIFIAHIFWDGRKKRRERIDTFIEPLLRLNTIIETKSIPDRVSHDGFITNLFAEQEGAMSVIRNRMDGKTKANFDKKWAEYKEEREGYKRYWDTNLKGKFSIHKRSDQLIVIIGELINIAKKI